MRDKLYLETLTRQNLTTANSATLKTLVELAMQEGIPDENIKDMFFLANFFGPDNNLSCVRHLKMQTEQMIIQIRATDIIDDIVKDRLSISADIFFRLLDKLPKELRDEVRRRKRGRKRETPITAFHLLALQKVGSRSPRLRPHMRIGYIRYGLDIHDLLRRTEHAYPERLEESARIMRHFVADYKGQYDDPSKLNKTIVIRVLNGIKEWDSQTLKQRKRFISRLFFGVFKVKKKGNRGYKRRKSIKGKRTRDLQEYLVIVDELTVDDRDNESNKKKRTVRLKTVSRPNPDGIAEGETPDDYVKTVEIETPVSPFVDRPDASTRKRFLNYMNYNDHFLPWQRKFKKLNELSLLYLHLVKDE